MAFLGVYGHVNVDYILLVKSLPQPDMTVPVEKELVRLGGTGGNLARAAAALGVPTALAACVGDDFPPRFREQLSNGHIELTDLRHVSGPTPKIWILSLPDGSQSAVIDQGVMGDGYQRPTLDYTMLNSKWVHFTTGDPQQYYALAKEARQAGKKVTFDPAQELSYRYDDRLFERFLNEAELFLVNEAELDRALKKLGYGEPNQFLDHAKSVVVTRGSKGSTLYLPGRKVDIPVCPVRTSMPKDTVGAGDVYRGGLYAALHAGEALEGALRTAAVAASLFLESGAETFPNRGALEQRRAEWRP